MADADGEDKTPDPTKSVADEIERRRKTGPQEHKTPEVTTEFGEASSPSEAQSDKPWSRNAGEVQDREVARDGTSPSGEPPPQG